MASRLPPPAWAIVAPPPPPPPRTSETSRTMSPARTLPPTSGWRLAIRTALPSRSAARTTADGPPRRFFTSSEIRRSPFTSAATTCPVTTLAPSICSAPSTSAPTSPRPCSSAPSRAAPRPPRPPPPPPPRPGPPHERPDLAEALLQRLLAGGLAPLPGLPAEAVHRFGQALDGDAQGGREGLRPLGRLPGVAGGTRARHC